jgi:hypothetical protein
VFLAKSLTKEQSTRLRQIEFQLKEREFGAYAAFAMSAKDLGLRADQVEDVTSLKGLRVEEIAKLVTSGERFDKVKPKVEATNGDTYEKMTEMLTRTQRERLRELRGKAFGGKVDWVSPIKINLPTFDEAKTKSMLKQATYPPGLFGYYDFEFRYLDRWFIQREIGIKEDQLEGIRRELVSWEDAYKPLKDAPIERIIELHERSAKSISDNLTEKQRKRFDELMTRRRLFKGGWQAACGYPPVVAALKLSPNQLGKLKEGMAVEDVLSKSQLESLYTQTGPAFDFGPFFGFRFGDPIVSDLYFGYAARQLSVTSAFARHFLLISDRLKLSDEQIKKLRDLAENEPKFFELIQRELSLADTPPVIGSGRAFTPAAAVADQYREAVLEQCFNVLDDRQKSIVRQIFGLKPKR